MLEYSLLTPTSAAFSLIAAVLPVGEDGGGHGSSKAFSAGLARYNSIQSHSLPHFNKKAEYSTVKNTNLG